MKIHSLYLVILFIVLALVILIFASGYRRFYSGFFFAMIGIVLLVNTIRHKDQQ